MAKSRFLEGAARCEQFIKSIKERQAQAAGAEGFALEDAGNAPPEEAWARRFATHVFGSERCEAGRAPLSAFISLPAGTPRLPQLPQISTASRPADRAASGHIGAILGKAGPRHAFLRRIFRGPGN